MRWLPRSSRLSAPRWVQAAYYEGREPATGFILRLVELHRHIDVADLERTARVGAEDPDLAHPRQVATLGVHAAEETLDPSRRLQALHSRRLRDGKRPAYGGLGSSRLSIGGSPCVGQRSGRVAKPLEAVEDQVEPDLDKS